MTADAAVGLALGRRLAAPLMPGLAAAALVAAAARLLSGVLPSFVGEVLLAVLLGLVVGVAARRPATAPGLRFALARLLRVGVVLLGARLSLAAVVQVGLSVVLVVAVAIGLGLALTLVAGRALHLPLPVVLLIGVGTAICGNTAIVATAPIIEAEDRHVSVAVATITTFGMLAVLLFPVIGAALGIGDDLFGRWAGIAVNDTSQVVATGFAYSDRAGDVAVVVKLVRNAAMAPVLFLIGSWWMLRARRGNDPDGAAGKVRLLDAIPLFVVGFLALAAVNSVGLLDPVVAGASLSEWAGDLEKVLILVAVAAIGLSTSLATLRSTGPRPFLVGLGVSTVMSVAGLGLVVLTGAAGS
jgi:uncharacterized integral membrane protein (TIGR00698 family)